jgi:hypothetical protein
LAGLAHLYGLFFLVALALAHVLLWLRRGGVRLAHLAPLVMGAVLVWLPWLAVIVFNAGDFAAQYYQHAPRFALSDPAFYAANLLDEPRRYRAGFSSGAAWTRAGFWLLWLGAPLSLLALARLAWRTRAPGEIALSIAAATMPLLYALLLAQKLYNYVAPLAPLFAWLVAWALARLWAQRVRWLRAAVAALLVLVLLEGAGGWVRLHGAAELLPPPTAFDAALREAIPRSARVLGAPRFWLALSDHPYRSIALPLMLSWPRANRDAVPLDRALEIVNPQIVIIDKDVDALLADHSSPEADERAAEFTAYLQRRGARLLATLSEPASVEHERSNVDSRRFTPVRIFALETP